MSWPWPPDFLDFNLALEDLVSASNAVALSTSRNCNNDRFCVVRTGNHCLLFFEKKTFITKFKFVTNHLLIQPPISCFFSFGNNYRLQTVIF